MPAGARGLFFMSTLAVASANQNFMEGCVRMFSPPEQPWPGLLLSTGMEDYYDSAYYFDGGPFHAPVSGVTHLDVRAAEDVEGKAGMEGVVVVPEDGEELARQLRDQLATHLITRGGGTGSEVSGG